MKLSFEKQVGLLPVSLQDTSSKHVPMLGYINTGALAETWKNGEVHFFSRPRHRRCKKSETSGRLLRLKKMLLDCDADASLLLREPVVPGVCREAHRSRFFLELSTDGLMHVIAERAFSAEEVYRRPGGQ